MMDIPSELAPVQAYVATGLGRVVERLEAALASDLPPVQRLCRHVERYRGKMIRPTLAMICGLACDAGAARGELATSSPSAGVLTVATVCEMIHLATLVHDDVLDDADTRRGAQTINALRGNESAVILGDFLFSAAYRVCSELGDRQTSVEIASAGMTLCEGELLQNHHRGDFSLDEATYFRIVERKTASLIAAACRLGARHAGGEPRRVEAMGRFGLSLGVAFQIQDDLLDLTGEEAVVGKSLGKDVEKGKLTLPLIHHLASAAPTQRGESLRVLEDSSRSGTERGSQLRRLMASTGSIDHARRTAERLVDEARASLEVLEASPARQMLGLMADAVVNRAF